MRRDCFAEISMRSCSHHVDECLALRSPLLVYRENGKISVIHPCLYITISISFHDSGSTENDPM